MKHDDAEVGDVFCLGAKFLFVELQSIFFYVKGEFSQTQLTLTDAASFSSAKNCLFYLRISANFF
jgi:hypothetical protein